MDKHSTFPQDFKIDVTATVEQGTNYFVMTAVDTNTKITYNRKVFRSDSDFHTTYWFLYDLMYKHLLHLEIVSIYRK